MGDLTSNWTRRLSRASKAIAGRRIVDRIAPGLAKSFALCGLLALASGGAAFAHDHWANGDPVPAWVKSACCGPDDVHHLTPSQVHQTADGWRVDGYPDLIPIGLEQPSPDGEYWIFYRTLPNGDVTRVYCFFTPFQGT